MAMRLVVTSESLSFLIPDGKGLYDSKAVEADDMRSKGKRNRTGEQGCHPGQVIDLAELSAPYWEEGKDHSGPETEGRVEEGTVLGPLGP